MSLDDQSCRAHLQTAPMAKPNLWGILSAHVCFRPCSNSRAWKRRLHGSGTSRERNLPACRFQKSGWDQLCPLMPTLHTIMPPSAD